MLLEMVGFSTLLKRNLKQEESSNLTQRSFARKKWQYFQSAEAELFLFLSLAISIWTEEIKRDLNLSFEIKEGRHCWITRPVLWLAFLSLLESIPKIIMQVFIKITGLPLQLVLIVLREQFIWELSPGVHSEVWQSWISDTETKLTDQTGDNSPKNHLMEEKKGNKNNLAAAKFWLESRMILFKCVRGGAVTCWIGCLGYLNSDDLWG